MRYARKVPAGVFTFSSIPSTETSTGKAKFLSKEKFFPSIKAATVELNQIQGELTLDVLGAVTLGAISSTELDLAKQVAIPLGLDEPELIDFLQRKKAAQEKLKAYFNEQIQFLDQGGTIAGFLRSKQGQQGGTQQPAQQPQGQILQFDAQGNIIQ